MFRQRLVEFRHGGFNEGVERRQFIRKLVLQLFEILLLLNRRRGVGAVDAAEQRADAFDLWFCEVARYIHGLMQNSNNFDLFISCDAIKM